MSDVTIEQISKEISRNIVKILMPRIRRVVREEMETLKEDLLFEITETANVPKKEVPSRKKLTEEQRENLRDKVRKSVVSSDDPYSSLIESAGSEDENSPLKNAFVDPATMNKAGKLTVEQMEKKAKTGTYVDPSEADYSNLLGDL